MISFLVCIEQDHRAAIEEALGVELGKEEEEEEEEQPQGMYNRQLAVIFIKMSAQTQRSCI
jgi:hypothetical protein